MSLYGQLLTEIVYFYECFECEPEDVEEIEDVKEKV